ncbi:hypothetical protein [Dactylosporangium sp. CA-233914]|uniref:hypothetical protein n=1 Tax=Dactylosporangium sp. CA-233914 TaxID=3239934 RepID=UPI003D8CECC7
MVKQVPLASALGRSAFPALLLALLGASYVTPARVGIHVAGGRLAETGVKHGYAFGPGPASVFDDIRAAGANAVRVARVASTAIARLRAAGFRHALMAYCRQHVAWSWSGNSPQYGYLDIVSGYRPGRLTAWGRRLVDGRLWLAAAR